MLSCWCKQPSLKSVVLLLKNQYSAMALPLYVCRICLQKDVPMSSIFYTDNVLTSGLSVGDIISSCASVQVNVNDGLPQTVCCFCTHEVLRIMRFRNLCRRTDQELRKIIKRYQTSILHKSKDGSEAIKRESGNSTEQISDRLKADDFPAGEGAPCEGDQIGSEVQNAIPNDEAGARLAVSNNQMTEKNTDYFPRKEPLLKHLKPHTEDRPFKCETCDKSFRYKFNLLNHKARQHTKAKDADEKKLSMILKTRTQPIDREYRCETCGATFQRKSDLFRHLKTHNKLKEYGCDACGKHFSHKRTLKTHLRATCPTKRPNNTDCDDSAPRKRTRSRKS